mmetsp:Transcript_6726/g.12539  ORF Transcript_6726/g.12539 Transcript_6726/m.12539 type:complete len:408 (+) Transcript_6726:100-1323(+)
MAAPDPHLETQPLLSKTKASPRSVPFGTVDPSSVAAPTGDEEDDSNWNSSEYDHAVINSWRVLFIVTGSAFDNLSVLVCMLLSLLTSCVVAYFAFHARQTLFIKEEKIHNLGTFLNVFVGLLLGFFVSSSMNRWHGCVHGFMELLEAVRCMQMQMFALGVDRKRIDTLNRYGLMSAWLLHLSLNIECRRDPQNEKLCLSQATQKERIWGKLEEMRPNLVLPEEKKLLCQYTESYALIWTWMASLIGRMAEDGEIPPMPSPTYGRIIDIINRAYNSIRDVRSMHRIKAPFIYVNTLAVLVHFNTVLNSLSFGLILGMTMQVAFGNYDGEFKNKLPRLVASLFMQFCISMVGPLLYLCLLEVCVCISQPFTFLDSKIPSQPLILSLEEDLANAELMADNTKWPKPCFKK